VNNIDVLKIKIYASTPTGGEIFPLFNPFRVVITVLLPPAVPGVIHI